MATFHHHRTLYCLFLFCLSLQTCFKEALAEENQFFGTNWPISFKRNARTLPSIEVRLDPPEDPLPQVSAEILLLERSRLRMEEAGMAKLEDEYNKLLDSAQTEIDTAVDQAMRIFDNPQLLKAGVRHALLPITSKRKAIKAIKGSFAAPKLQMPVFTQRDKNADQGILANENNSIVKKHQIDSTHATSFLETKSTSQLKVINAIQKPSVQIMVDDIKAPDKKVKAKMDEIEQKRADEEAKMFEQAAEELNQLKKITLQELETNIQIQMNPFLVDTTSVVAQVEQELPKPGTLSKLLAFRGIDNKGEKFINDKCSEVAQMYSEFNIDCASLSIKNKTKHSSFLEVHAETETKAAAGLRNQLNVRLGQSDKPYPTVDQLFSEAQKKRDATERLERMKILQLQLKFLKAMNEMIKEKLRFSVARVLAQFGPVVETIKTEIAAEELS